MTKPQKRAVILVPVAYRVSPATEESLYKLISKGFCVRKVYGHSAVDQVRCMMAHDVIENTNAEYLFWIDSDVGFQVEDVLKLLDLDLAFTCGLYPAKRDVPTLVGEPLTTEPLSFGAGLREMRYAPGGFTCVHRSVYEEMGGTMPVCNRRFGAPFRPYYQPMWTWETHSQEYRYLSEDYAFSFRAAKKGFDIFADLSLNLKHFGERAYSF